MVAWLDNYLARIIDSYGPGLPMVRSISRSSSPASLPWARLTLDGLRSILASDAWKGAFRLVDFDRLARRAFCLDNSIESSRITSRLFHCFDRDGNGLLDFREVFIGMAILCGSTREERLEAAFSIMDADGSGTVSRDEVEEFLLTVAPRQTSEVEIQKLASAIMCGADMNDSGKITFLEVIYNVHAQCCIIDCFAGSSGSGKEKIL